MEELVRLLYHARHRFTGSGLQPFYGEDAVLRVKQFHTGYFRH